MGVSHRDISLENVLVDQMTKAAIIDLGMCLRVPFGADDGSIVDVTKGTLRRLISPQGQCGKPNYISPEVHLNVEKHHVQFRGLLAQVVLLQTPEHRIDVVFVELLV